MIQVNELRLGNCLKQGKIIELRQNVCRIEYASDKRRTALISYTDLKPIKLTEEILLKCGFTKDTQTSYRWFLGKNIGFDIDDGGFRYDNSWEFPIIKHLHKLQNIYYALTGKELNIEL